MMEMVFVHARMSVAAAAVIGKAIRRTNRINL